MTVQSAGKTTITASPARRPTASRNWRRWVRNGLVYLLLTVVALIMIFPFLIMLFTSLKVPTDTFSYPPRLLPREQITTTIEGEKEPVPLYNMTMNGQQREMALVQDNIKIGVYANPNDPATTFERPVKEVKPTGGFMKQAEGHGRRQGRGAMGCGGGWPGPADDPGRADRLRPFCGPPRPDRRDPGQRALERPGDQTHLAPGELQRGAAAKRPGPQPDQYHVGDLRRGAWGSW